MKTNKKGFTLIELMVVIVIIGILAAIAIPKLFGMTAKAKAAEVGGAVGTWVKLQQAFELENSIAGNFKSIGYTAPGVPGSSKKETCEFATSIGIGTVVPKSATSNFCYAESGGQPPQDESEEDAGDAVFEGATWYASNVGNLNLCANGSTWAATFNNGTNEPFGEIKGDEECTTLTPSFKKIAPKDPPPSSSSSS
ncbi:hypothetical protein AGMMS49938_07270 [Fibrobacterales bacterium]|nr:hypothetical protein AGMMS49938_07270 [Fibrobacterales bacterium]